MSEMSRRKVSTIFGRSLFVVLLLGVSSLMLTLTLTSFVAKDSAIIHDAPDYGPGSSQARGVASQVQATTATPMSLNHKKNSSISLLNNCLEQSGKASDNTKRDQIRPVKVFILMGQSNMYGQGLVSFT
jgi:hypothetical protein